MSYRLIVMESDGVMNFAVGEHAQEVGKWLDAAQTVACIHGSQYVGRRMEEGSWGDLPEPERARIHALTRKVTVSDEELSALIYKANGWRGVVIPGTRDQAWINLIIELRDRYEERGKYAATATATTDEAKPAIQLQTGWCCPYCGWSTLAIPTGLPEKCPCCLHALASADHMPTDINIPNPKQG